MAIRFFDMFAGIGGFRSGLEAVHFLLCKGVSADILKLWETVTVR